MRRPYSYYARIKEEACPTCAAKSGEWCWTASGKPKSGYHAERIRVAEKAMDARTSTAART
jgi:hypothetical protein